MPADTAPPNETEASGLAHATIGMGQVARSWWPLAASWLLMGLELPALSAVLARLDEPTVNLAAFGGIVFPVAFIIESPIIMLLAASTALSRDWASYVRLRRFMTRLSMVLTALHVLVAFTPLYDIVALHLIDAPPATIEPARLSLQLLTPWTWAIAHRRFHQGVLIRFGRPHMVGIGTAMRLAATCLVLLAGYLFGGALPGGAPPGAAVAGAALTVGVLAEAIFVRLAVGPILRGPLRAAVYPDGPMSYGRILAFYVPLALTPLLGLLSQPIGSAAMSRMPSPLLSLAAWPALGGLVFLPRSLSLAFNEVVVSCASRPGARPVLWRFSLLLGATTTLALVLMAATPLGRLWFGGVCGLDADLTRLATGALWLTLLLPSLTALHSFFQGHLVNAHRTRGIPESMAVFLVTIVVVFAIATHTQQIEGLYVTQVALTLGAIAQLSWLAWRCRPVLARTEATPPAALALTDTPPTR